VAQQTHVNERAPSPPQPPAPSAAPPAATPAPTPPSPAQTSAAWRQALAAWLASHKVYPEEARRRGEQGSVTVRFTVDPSGEVVNVAVVRGSGSAGLDAAAEAMLRGATLPPFDPTMRQAPVTATVQIRYALD
jgi:periplasmic protein TonB